MTPIFSSLPALLGVYRLTMYLGSQERSDRYLATQTHVERYVVVEVLHPDAEEEEIRMFVATARARVAAELPHVTKVLESMVSDNLWYITQELPPGSPLIPNENTRRFSADVICMIIIAAAELYIAAREGNLAVGPLSPSGVFITRKKLIHFLSPVTVGEYDATCEPACMQALADLLAPYLPQEGPGSTRVATLCEWLRHGYEGEFLDWEGIKSTAETVRQQLNPNGSDSLESRGVKLVDSTANIRKDSRHRRRTKRTLIMGAASLLTVLGMSQLGHLIPLNPPEQISPFTKQYVLCKTNSTVQRLMRTPVTIDDYAKFLMRFENMSAEEKEKLHKGMPETVKHHTPAEWDDMYQSAREGWTWKGRAMTLESPVVNICYWDALAYARFSNAALPTAALLQAARSAGLPQEMEEWTSTRLQNDAILGNCRLILPRNSTTPQAAFNADARSEHRTFRLLRTRGK